MTSNKKSVQSSEHAIKASQYHVYTFKMERSKTKSDHWIINLTLQSGIKKVLYDMFLPFSEILV